MWNLTEGWPIAGTFNRLGYHVFILTYQVECDEKLLEKDLDVIIDDRFDGILEEAYQDLYDARDEFEDKRIEAASELDDARQELERL